MERAGIFQELTPSVAYATGFLAGLFVGPDLDLDIGNNSHGKVKRLNRILGWGWRLFWWPYAKVFKHRGPSHAPIIGTLVRALYIWLVGYLVWKLFGAPTLPFRLSDFGGWWPLLVGLGLADLCHILQDSTTGR